jgi:hypothetical protein
MFKELTLAAALALGVSVQAPDGNTVDLRGEDWDDARGEAVITDVQDDEKEIRIDASGLEPNATYSVWLINDAPLMGEMGIGSGDLIFESDELGRGFSVMRIPSEQFKDWDKIEVMHHPNRDTEDVESAELTLTGVLYQQR